MINIRRNYLIILITQKTCFILKSSFKYKELHLILFIFLKYKITTYLQGKRNFHLFPLKFAFPSGVGTIFLQKYIQRFVISKKEIYTIKQPIWFCFTFFRLRSTTCNLAYQINSTIKLKIHILIDFQPHLVSVSVIFLFIIISWIAVILY